MNFYYCFHIRLFFSFLLSNSYFQNSNRQAIDLFSNDFLFVINNLN